MGLLYKSLISVYFVRKGLNGPSGAFSEGRRNSLSEFLVDWAGLFVTTSSKMKKKT